MKRNSTTIYLSSLGATTPIPWVNNAPDFTGITEPTLSVLTNAWNDFVANGGVVEVILDPEPFVEPIVPNWDGFNAYMLSDVMFKSYRDAVRTVDGDLTPALYNAYQMVGSNGVGAFSLVWGAWAAASGITVVDKNIVATVAESFNLPTEFVSAIRG